MLIHVTYAHLRRGTPGDCRLCPVALAIAEQAGIAVVVTEHRAFVAGAADTIRWHIGTAAPDIVRRAVRCLDSGSPCEPFTFELPDDFIAKAKEASHDVAAKG